MASLTDTAENRVLDWLTGNPTTAPTAPLKVALLTANGSDSAAGTEVTGGSYARQTVTFDVAASGATANTSLIRFTGMPTCTVTGAAIYDSAATPVRWFHGALAAPKTLTSGDVFEFAVGDLDLTAA